MSGEQTGDDLAELRRLLGSGTKVPQLRVLRVVCPHGRTLVDVLRFNRRNMLTYRSSRHVGRDAATGHIGIQRRQSAQVRELTGDSLTFYATTGCCAVAVNDQWITERLAEQNTRVVAPTRSA